MADILSTGVSGLRAFQRALDVTSHNIANVATPGFNRQRVELQTREAERFGDGFLGTGVNVSTIARSYDDLLSTQLRGATSSSSRLDVYAGKAQVLNNLFSDASTGLSASLQRFTNAVQGVSNEPTSTAARQVLLSEAQGLTQRLQTYNGRLDDINAEINSRLTGEAATITSIASSIAKLNQQIVTAQTSGQAPNDLLDERDRQLSSLSEHLSVQVVKQDDGAWNVFVGNGQSLVLGNQSSRIVTQRDAFDPSRVTIAYQAGSTTSDMSSTISGGSLGGLLDFRRELLDPVRNQLGQIAIGVASAVNAQHREGMDLQGNLGGDLFAVGGVGVLARGTNTGSAVIAATRTSAGALTSGDYLLEFNGTAWSARRADTGAAVALSGTGTALDPFVADGLAIVVGGAAAAGDSFRIQPTAGAISGMRVLVSDPARIAAAAPIRTGASLANTGTGSISAGEVLDAANPSLRNGVSIAFIDATHYSVNGAGSFSYSPGGNIDVNGWRVAISGAPAAGDTFTVASNAGGVGDNRNMLAMMQSLSQGVLSGGSESVNGAVSRFVGGIGVATNQAQAGADAQKVILQDSRAAVDSVGGVNLDEEAANMLRYQQAYQAAAQVIRITQDMFDTLLRATQR
ncbi:MAG TPA: flagellar hook-associated protein FlgK [Steroidobacteraceae bacterium]|nr:flagellar hook-associated protein FlgK [Steroidobacteraceae bacterium]